MPKKWTEIWGKKKCVVDSGRVMGKPSIGAQSVAQVWLLLMWLVNRHPTPVLNRNLWNPLGGGVWGDVKKKAVHDGRMGLEGLAPAEPCHCCVFGGRRWWLAAVMMCWWRVCQWLYDFPVRPILMPSCLQFFFLFCFSEPQQVHLISLDIFFCVLFSRKDLNEHEMYTPHLHTPRNF